MEPDTTLRHEWYEPLEERQMKMTTMDKMIYLTTAVVLPGAVIYAMFDTVRHAFINILSMF